MELYLEGLIVQQMARANALVHKIPTELPKEFHPLITSATTLLQSCLMDLQHLYQAPQMLDPESQHSRASGLRKIVQDMNTLETVAITALARADVVSDTLLNRLIHHLCQTIHYPLCPPIATSLSTDYFHIYPTYNLIRVPLIEMQFLLHLPDLLHELAHPFFFPENQDVQEIKPVITVLEEHHAQVSEYFMAFVQREQSRHPDPRLEIMLEAWEYSWIMYWGVEFMADLFAVFTVGPAFAWSHIYLVMKRPPGGTPFEVPLYSPVTHPSDDARMKLMLTALRALGFKDEADQIDMHWKQVLTMLGEHSNARYRDCYAEHLLTPLAQAALAAFAQAGITRYTGQDHQISGLLNKAWETFWEDPNNYANWEEQQVSQLAQTLLKP